MIEVQAQGERGVDVDRTQDARRNRHLLRRWMFEHGIVLRLDEHSLSIALFLRFFASFALHAVSGARVFAQEQRWHGEPPPGLLDYVGSSTFRFEVFQNWQSEFLAVAVFTWLTVYLRERGSARSKPVAMAHDQIEE